MTENDDPLVSATDAARELGLATGTLASWRCTGRGPRFVKIGRSIFYRRTAIAAWVKSQERDPYVASAT